MASEAIFKVYFIENSLLSEQVNLVEIAKQIGLDESQTPEIINSDRCKQEISDDEEKAYKMGISAVSFFIIDDKFSISGAQGTPDMPEVIKGQKLFFYIAIKLYTYTFADVF
ncbi:DsbA family oxidoreductase [Campylobacter sp. 7477a]|uniref:DsbA family oxidoreductase n=1 Tax=Campylobacter sp. 7477a TaxID=2735741 RepID=UPI0030148A78|nr:DsbA family protein [Campylobacter sp. 7477a]